VRILNIGRLKLYGNDKSSLKESFLLMR